MSRKFVVINALTALAILILTACFSINDDIYGWSDRLSVIIFIQSLVYALLYKVKTVNIYWKADTIQKDRKLAMFYFCFYSLLYAFILTLFCKEHLSVLVSESLLRIIILFIFSTGAAVTWIYAAGVKRDIEKERQKEA
jgi:hypothetical protein